MNFTLSSSPLWILPSLLLSLGLAYLLYKNSAFKEKKIKIVLFVLRSLLLFTLFLLLLNPILNHFQRTVIKPKVVFLIDDSESVIVTKANKKKVLENIVQLKQELETKGNEVVLTNLNNEMIKNIDSIQFSQPITNLEKALSNVKNDFSQDHLGGVVLFSDGIQNRGVNPAFKNYFFPIHCVGLGDTTIQKDIVLEKVRLNEKVSPETEFPVQLNIRYDGYSGQKTKLSIFEGNKKVMEKLIFLNPNTNFLSHKIHLTAPAKEGVYSYRVAVSPLEGEFLTTNNQKKIFVEVVKEERNILIAAATPHPDIRAIKQVLEKDKRNKVNVFVATRGDKLVDFNNQLVIFHQLPNKSKIADVEFKKLIQSKSARFFIASKETDFTRYNRYNDCIKINARLNQNDKVFPLINSQFMAFDLNEKEYINELPPVEVPFGSFTAKSGSETVLFQKIGSVESERPLLSINTNRNIPNAVLAGVGVWGWRAFSYDEQTDKFLLDELIEKVCKNLTIQSKRDRFIFEPQKKVFSQVEDIAFDMAFYNKLYKKIGNGNVKVTVFQSGKLLLHKEVLLGTQTPSFEALKPGKYEFKATISQNDSVFTSAGSFFVESINYESLVTFANHNLLKTLSGQSSGYFVPNNQAAQLASLIETKALLRTKEDSSSIIKFKWIFFVFMIIISLEWTLRKTRSTI